MNKKFLFICYILILVLADQFLKWLVIKYFPNIVIVNSGVLFGWISNITISYWILVIGLLAIIWIIRNADLKIANYLWAVILIVAGGFSNIIDRLAREYVVDYIYLGLWPTFNLADIFITLGVLLFLWTSWKKK